VTVTLPSPAPDAGVAEGVAAGEDQHSSGFGKGCDADCAFGVDWCGHFG